MHVVYLLVLMNATALQIVKQAVKIAKASRPLEVDTRPTRWDDVVFKCVPLQEGEEGAVEVRLRLLFETFHKSCFLDDCE